MNRSKRFLLGMSAALAGLWGLALVAAPPAAIQASPSVTIRFPVRMDLSPPLRDMKPIPPPEGTTAGGVHVVPLVRPPLPKLRNESAVVDPVVQSWQGKESMPAPLQSWDGIGNIYGYVPPDTEGDVGPNNYMQWVNVSMAIWDKSGNLLWGPVDGNTIWNGFGGPADSCNDGDPIVLYDRLADRWIVSQFALCANNGNGPFYQYIAVSQTGDPTGAWYRYAYEVGTTAFGDYPKFGVWPDGYYMTVNQFSNTWEGVGVYVFDRAAMLAGNPNAAMQYINLGAVDLNHASLLPAEFEGSNPPPPNEPEYFLEIGDAGSPTDPDFKQNTPTPGTLNLWAMHVDWNNPANTIFGVNDEPSQAIDVAPFLYMCGGNAGACISQPGTTAKLDTLGDRLMYRLQYRNMGGFQSLVVNHTVDVDGTNHAGVRWYELHNNSGTWSLYQQGSYAPDGDSRWMGSAAMDHEGDLAIGYSVSSTTTYPSIRYAGRLAGDPLNELTQGEATLIAGTGSQTVKYDRWGDYSTLSVDPSDDCTFWYTQEYYPTTTQVGWHTRIGSFRFPSCGVTLTPSATPATGGIPFTTTLSAAVAGGQAPLTYDWDFGDGSAHSSDASPSHTYTTVGTFTYSVMVTDALKFSVTTQGAVVATVPPPVISAVKKQAPPFRLLLTGSNLHDGCTVFVNGTSVPHSLWKNAGKVVAKGGSALKAMVPKGTTVQITVKNNDDGGLSAPYSFSY